MSGNIRNRRSIQSLVAAMCLATPTLASGTLQLAADTASGETVANGAAVKQASEPYDDAIHRSVAVPSATLGVPAKNTSGREIQCVGTEVVGSALKAQSRINHFAGAGSVQESSVVGTPSAAIAPRRVQAVKGRVRLNPLVNEAAPSFRQVTQDAAPSNHPVPPTRIATHNRATDLAEDSSPNRSSNAAPLTESSALGSLAIDQIGSHIAVRSESGAAACQNPPRRFVNDSVQMPSRPSTFSNASNRRTTNLGSVEPIGLTADQAMIEDNIARHSAVTERIATRPSASDSLPELPPPSSSEFVENGGDLIEDEDALVIAEKLAANGGSFATPTQEQAADQDPSSMVQRLTGWSKNLPFVKGSTPKQRVSGGILSRFFE